MEYYCAKCRKAHSDDELCPHIKSQLKESPHLISEATDFANVAGQYHLVTSQSLDVVAQKVNGIICCCRRWMTAKCCHKVSEETDGTRWPKAFTMNDFGHFVREAQ